MSDLTLTNGPLTKVCHRCGDEKPLGRFRKCRFTVDGLTHKCKDCVKMPPRFFGVWLGIIHRSYADKLLADPGKAPRVWLLSGRPSEWRSGCYERRPDWFRATRNSGKRMGCKLLDLKTETVVVNTLDIREAVWVANQTFPELEEARAEWVTWKAQHPEISNNKPTP